MENSKIVPIQSVCNAVVYTASITALIDEKYCEINLADVCYRAQIIYSCLIKPAVGDIVMCVLNEEGDYYVSGIVDRKSTQSMVLNFTDDVTLSSSGAINIHSSDSVTLSASESINCLSKKVLHKSDSAVVNYQGLILSGAVVLASYTTIRVFSQMINTISNQVMQKFKNYIRSTDELDQVKAQNMTRRVDGLYSMSSDNTVMLSKKDIKIDAEHIHMG